MRFRATPEEAGLAAAYQSFFTKEAGPAAARAAEPLGFDPQLWDKAAAAGLTNLAAENEPATVAEQAIVARELGASISPMPLVEHMAATATLRRLGGRLTGGVATLVPLPGPGSLRRNVPAGAICQQLVALDRGELVAISQLPASRAHVANFAALPWADLELTDGTRQVLAGGPEAKAEFRLMRANWQVLTAAALVGAATSALRMTVEYVLARHQFGTAIGANQAVQHGLADVRVALAGAELLVARAAWAADQPAGSGTVDLDHNEVTDPIALAHMAFLFAASTAKRVTAAAVQYHGGLGYSREHDVQLFYRRVRGWTLQAGDSHRLRDDLTLRLIGRT